MNEPQEILEIFGKRPTTIKPGLSRTREAWDLLGRPGSQIRTILVGGTNGKGSTSGLLWHLLACAGHRVGYFSSPHLIYFRERIDLSHRELANDELVVGIKHIKSIVPQQLWNELTFFEINTLLALIVFESEKLDFAVLEVGLGGRLDSTNIVEPVLSIITNIGLDHMVYLGDTTAKIASEKAGIMREQRVCLWGGVANSDEASDIVIKNEAKARKTTLKVLGSDFWLTSEGVCWAPGAKFYSLPERVKKWPLFLRENFAIAFAGFLELLRMKGQSETISETEVNNALDAFGRGAFKWPKTLKGRFHLVRIRKAGFERILLMDVCHNPHGAKAFANALEETQIATCQAPKPAFLSILVDKDAGGIWDVLKGRISEVLRFRIPSSRSWSETSDVPGVMHSSFGAALQVALKRDDWGMPHLQPWLVCGSVAAIGQVWLELEADGWAIESID